MERDNYEIGTLAEAFPHLPDPLSRDPNDVDQPLLPSRPSGREPAGNQADVTPQPSVPSRPPGREPTGSQSNNNPQRQGGARPRTLSFSKPKKGNFSYRRRPDVSAIQQLIRDSLS